MDGATNGPVEDFGICYQFPERCGQGTPNGKLQAGPKLGTKIEGAQESGGQVHDNKKRTYSCGRLGGKFQEVAKVNLNKVQEEVLDMETKIT